MTLSTQMLLPKSSTNLLVACFRFCFGCSASEEEQSRRSLNLPVNATTSTVRLALTAAVCVWVGGWAALLTAGLSERLLAPRADLIALQELGALEELSDAFPAGGEMPLSIGLQ